MTKELRELAESVIADCDLHSVGDPLSFKLKRIIENAPAVARAYLAEHPIIAELRELADEWERATGKDRKTEMLRRTVAKYDKEPS